MLTSASAAEISFAQRVGVGVVLDDHGKIVQSLRDFFGEMNFSPPEIHRPADNSRSTIDQAARGDRDTVIFLRADKSVPYGEMMEVMNLLRGAGYLKVALVGLEKGPTP